MTKEQAVSIIEKARNERAKRAAYNQKRWALKKALLAEASKLVSSTK